MDLKISVFSFSDYRKVNGDNFSISEYISIITKKLDYSQNSYNLFERFFFPNFEIVDDLCFNESTSSKYRYFKMLDNGVDKEIAFYFAGIFNFSSHFELDEDVSRECAIRLCKYWNWRLLDYNIFEYIHEVIEDEGEYCISLKRNSI